MSQIQSSENTQDQQNLPGQQKDSPQHVNSEQTTPNSQPSLSPTQTKKFFQSLVNNLNSPLTTPNLDALQSQTDQERIDLENLFSDQISTEPIDPDFNTSFQTQNKDKINSNRKNSIRSLQNLIDDIKKAGDNRSDCANKPSKNIKEIFNIPIKWPKRIPEAQGINEKEINKGRKRPLSNNERLNDSRSQDENNKTEKKVIRTAVKDLELNFGSHDKYVSDGDAFDGLFEEETSEREVHSCKNSREVGPIRYSKMSEEDAAMIFELRRKELINFLKKLGSNSNFVKKKQSKKPGGSKQGNLPDQSSDSKRSHWEREVRLKALKDNFKDSLSPTTFIIYNTAPESLWNGPPLGKVKTPLKENKKRQFSSLKISGDLPFDSKRRSSVKSQKEKEESQLNVQRNLESSFNKIAQDFIESSEKKPLKKPKQRVDSSGRIIDKREASENLKIDLKKEILTKKKKKKVENNDKKVETHQPQQQTQISQLEKPEKMKRVNEFANENEMESQTIKENAIHKGLIEKMRKKNQEVLGDIEEIENLIQRMEAEQAKPRPPPFNNSKSIGKDERKKNDMLKESYLDVAKSRRSKSRPRSVVMGNSFQETKKEFLEDQNLESISNKKYTNSKVRSQIEEISGQKKEINFTYKISGDYHAENKTRAQTFLEDERFRGLEILENKTNLKTEERSLKQNNLSKSMAMRKAISNAVSTQDNKKKMTSSNLRSLDLGRGTPNEQSLNQMSNEKSTSTSILKIESLSSPKQMMKGNIQPQLDSQKDKEKNKTSSVTSTLQSTRYTSLNNSTSPNSELFTVGKSYSSIESFKNKKQDLDLLLSSTKREPTSSKTTTRKRFEQDKTSQMGLTGRQLNYLSHDNFPENMKSSPKISFFEEVKKILKDGSKDDKNNPEDRAKRTKNNPKEETIKRDIPNKPKFDATSTDLRAKIYKEPRLIDEITKNFKLSVSGNNPVKKSDLKSISESIMRSEKKSMYASKNVATCFVLDSKELQSPVMSFGQESDGYGFPQKAYSKTSIVSLNEKEGATTKIEETYRRKSKGKEENKVSIVEAFQKKKKSSALAF